MAQTRANDGIFDTVNHKLSEVYNKIASCALIVRSDVSRPSLGELANLLNESLPASIDEASVFAELQKQYYTTAPNNRKFVEQIWSDIGSQHYILWMKPKEIAAHFGIKDLAFLKVNADGAFEVLTRSRQFGSYAHAPKKSPRNKDPRITCILAAQPRQPSRPRHTRRTVRRDQEAAFDTMNEANEDDVIEAEIVDEPVEKPKTMSPKKKKTGATYKKILKRGEEEKIESKIESKPLSASWGDIADSSSDDETEIQPAEVNVVDATEDEENTENASVADPEN